MANTGNETHSGNLSVLQQLPPTHFVNEKACPSQKQQQQPDLQICLNNSFQLLSDTHMSKLENLTSKIREKRPCRVKAEVKRLRKSRQFDDEGASSEPPSESESELEEQVKQRKKKQKIKINPSRPKADERKECQKESTGESDHEYDDRVSIHANDESELACNLNNFLGTNKKSEDEDSDSGLKRVIQERRNSKARKYGKKVNKDTVNKVWLNPNVFEKFETKIKTYKKLQNCSNLLVKKMQ